MNQYKELITEVEVRGSSKYNVLQTKMMFSCDSNGQWHVTVQKCKVQHINSINTYFDHTEEIEITSMLEDYDMLDGMIAKLDL